MPSKAERQRMRRVRAKDRARKHYARLAGQPELPQAPREESITQKIVGLPTTQNELRILNESIFKLEELSFGVLTHNKLSLLYADGIHAVRILVTRSEDDLLAIKGIGVTTVTKIKNTISPYGATLRTP